MIVRDKPSAWQLLFVLRGSIIPTIAVRLASVTLLSVPAMLVVAIVSYTFFGPDALGDELGCPFGFGQSAHPPSAMTRGIEIGIREMLGETALPEDLKPVDFILT